MHITSVQGVAVLFAVGKNSQSLEVDTCRAGANNSNFSRAVFQHSAPFPKLKENDMKKTLLPILGLLLLITATGSAFAQSTNRDHPTPLSSNEIKGELNGREIEYFFSFTAGPGEVTITVDVKSSDGTTGTNFELLDSDANKQLLCCEYAQADSTGTTGRDVKSIKLRERQTVVLHLTPFKYGRGSYRVRLTGATDLGAHER